MGNLTFGEQVKIVLGRKGMTIKELASIIEERTGKKMSRQNLTQRLGRDNFQEQDMRMIASILGCPFRLSIMDEEDEAAVANGELQSLLDESLDDEPVEDVIEEIEEPIVEKPAAKVEEKPHEIRRGGTVFLRRQGDPLPEAEPVEEHKEKEHKVEEHKAEEHHEEVKHEEVKHEEVKHEPVEHATFEPIIKRVDIEEDREAGDLNPYTGREYQSNSVRMHPKRIGYVQVYNRKDHKWTDMTEWAFLGYQEREKIRLGEDYEPPIYLD